MYTLYRTIRHNQLIKTNKNTIISKLNEYKNIHIEDDDYDLQAYPKELLLPPLNKKKYNKEKNDTLKQNVTPPTWLLPSNLEYYPYKYIKNNKL